MAARITFSLLAICLLQFAVWVPPPAATATILDEFKESANGFLNNLKTHFKSVFSTQSREDIKQFYQATSDALVSKYKGVHEQMKHYIQETSITLDAAVTDMKSKHPELDIDIRSSVKKGVQNLL